MSGWTTLVQAETLSIALGRKDLVIVSGQRQTRPLGLDVPQADRFFVADGSWATSTRRYGDGDSTKPASRTE